MRAARKKEKGEARRGWFRFWPAVTIAVIHGCLSEGSSVIAVAEAAAQQQATTAAVLAAVAGEAGRVHALHTGGCVHVLMWKGRIFDEEMRHERMRHAA